MLMQTALTPTRPQPLIVMTTTFLMKLRRSPMIRQVEGTMRPPPLIVTMTTFLKKLRSPPMISQVEGAMWHPPLIVTMTTFLMKLRRTSSISSEAAYCPRCARLSKYCNCVECKRCEQFYLENMEHACPNHVTYCGICNHKITSATNLCYICDLEKIIEICETVTPTKQLHSPPH